MKYVFKMMAVVFISSLFLGSCQTTSYSSSQISSYETYMANNFKDNDTLGLKKRIISLIDYNITRSIEQGQAKKYGNNNFNNQIDYKSYFSKKPNKALAICINDNYFVKFNNDAVVTSKNSYGVWWDETKKDSIRQTKKKALDICLKNQTANCKCKILAVNQDFFVTETEIKNAVYTNKHLLSSYNISTYAYKNTQKTHQESNITISSAELDAANKRASELERKLAALENKQKQEQQRIDTDTRVPLLEIISIKTKGKRGTITGTARDNIEVAEVTIDGKPVSITSNGNFKYSTYVPTTGLELNIQVTDIAGLTSSKIVVLKADRALANSSISFDRLNPLGKRVSNNKDALALIVGVSSYENTKAKAMYADNDALVFKDYATEKLGISENRIKVLINDGADYGEILLTTKDWLRRASKSNKSDIYIFFAGHGLASDDGKNMYLLPYDGRPRLLDKTALLRDELFKEIQQSNPRSVTVFLDTCYSGTTRGTDMLIASRPIAIRALKQSIPNNFTVFSAAAGDQTSKPLEEAKHGMFSYFLMKGMEGDADTNSDNKITAQELHNYVKENVTQQSSGSQTPELQGNKNRVLVQFN